MPAMPGILLTHQSTHARRVKEPSYSRYDFSKQNNFTQSIWVFVFFYLKKRYKRMKKKFQLKIGLLKIFV